MRSPVLIRKVMTSLGSLIGHAKERGKFAGANPVRELGKSKRGVHRRRGEKRQKGRLQVGRDIPSPEEIKRLLGAAAILNRVKCRIPSGLKRNSSWYADSGRASGRIESGLRRLS